MIGSEHLRPAFGDADKFAHQTHPGMAGFAGSGPQGKTCRECIHFSREGYFSKSHSQALSLKPGRCSKYRQLMNARGAAFPHWSPACVRYEPNPKPPPEKDPQTRFA